MEELQDLYDQIEQQALAKRRHGSKAELIRTFVKNCAAYLNNDRLAFDALYLLAERRLTNTKFDKGYFKTVVKESWKIEADAEGILWVIVK